MFPSPHAVLYLGFGPLGLRGDPLGRFSGAWRSGSIHCRLGVSLVSTRTKHQPYENGWKIEQNLSETYPGGTHCDVLG